jgi:hypothetical protein
LATAALVAAVGLVWPVAEVAAQSRASRSALRDLSGVAQLRADFNGDQSRVRVVLLLSPT